MRHATTLAVLLTACGPAIPHCPPGALLAAENGELVCAGGSSDGGAPDGGVASTGGTVTILEAPCDGGSASNPTATFTLPAWFNEGVGDTLDARACNPSCSSVGLVCSSATAVTGDGILTPAAGDVVRIFCGQVADDGESDGAVVACDGTEAFLQLVQ